MITRLSNLLAHIADRILAHANDPWRVPASMRERADVAADLAPDRDPHRYP